MNQALMNRLSVLTEEERHILQGEPLCLDNYADDASLVVKGHKMLPPRRMITLRPHTRFVTFPAHSHDYVEMLYMVSGSTIHEFPGAEPLELTAGDILLMNCRSVHAIRQCGAGDVGVNLMALPGFFDDAIEAVGSGNTVGRFLMDALKRGESTLPYLHFHVADVPAVQSLVESMVYTLVEETIPSQRILKSAMTLLMLHLMERADHMTLPAGGGNALVVAVLDEIRHNYAAISLKDFAASHHVSAAYLSQTVRRATGLSCTEHLQRQRISQAKRLLRETDLSVMDVCCTVGYSNTSHFYRLFTQACGMNPTQYRLVNSGREIG